MKIVDQLDFWFSNGRFIFLNIGFLIVGIGILILSSRKDQKTRKTAWGCVLFSGSIMLLLLASFWLKSDQIKRSKVREYVGKIISINNYDKTKVNYHENFQLDTVKNHVFSCEMECDMTFHMYQNNVRVPANPLQIGVRVKLVESNSRQIVRLEVIDR
jgi:hypothetical protein